MLEQLEADGLADNTIVFFFSDHGKYGFRAKQWMYDTGLNIPLIIWSPGDDTYVKPGTRVPDQFDVVLM